MKAGLYIHVPFCQRKCNYCDFYSITAKSRIPDFIAALKREMDFYHEWWPEYDTLYLGGGTPSLLTIEQLDELLKSILKVFTFTTDAEWSIEVNPDDLSLSYLQALRSMGFNRLSLGLQSLRDDNLAWLGRRHKASQGRQAIEFARRAGFYNLGVDLIYGLPKLKDLHGNSVKILLQEWLQQWFQELTQVIEYEPEHISCYQLSFEPCTRLMVQQRRGLIQPLNKAEESRFFLATSGKLESCGYLHYEVSNFSRGERFGSRHNQKYWQHLPYLGLGPSAHSFGCNQRLGHNQRWWNHRSLSLYIQYLQQKRPPIAGEENLTLEELRLETLYLGFRTRQGINLAEFLQQFGQDLLVDPPGLAYQLINDKKLELREGRLCPTRQGLAVADALALLW